MENGLGVATSISRRVPGSPVKVIEYNLHVSVLEEVYLVKDG